MALKTWDAPLSVEIHACNGATVLRPWLSKAPDPSIALSQEDHQRERPMNCLPWRPMDTLVWLICVPCVFFRSSSASWIYLEPSNNNHHMRQHCQIACGPASFFFLFDSHANHSSNTPTYRHRFHRPFRSNDESQLAQVADFSEWMAFHTTWSGHCNWTLGEYNSGDWTEGMEGLCRWNGFDHPSGFIFLRWVFWISPTGSVTPVFIMLFGRSGGL